MSLLESLLKNAQGFANPMAGGMGGLAIPDEMNALERLLQPSLGGRPEHTGMFGLKGTPRDILGVLGDAFLTQSGNKPTYGPTRHSEKMGDALQGLNEDPETAIQQLAAIDPVLGAKYYDYLTDSRNAQSKLAQTADTASYKKELALRTSVGGLVGAATPQTYPAIYATVKSIADRNNAPWLLDGLPTSYEPNQIASWSRGTMNVNQQQMDEGRDATLGLGKEKLGWQKKYQGGTLGVAQQNADTGAGRLDEAKRHNPVVEGVSQQRADTYKESVYNPRARPKADGTTPRPGAVTGSTGSTGAPPPFNPSRPGQRVKNKEGKIWVSPDGKTWKAG